MSENAIVRAESCRSCAHCKRRHVKRGVNTSGRHVCMVLGTLVPDVYLNTPMCSALYYDARLDGKVFPEREATMTKTCGTCSHKVSYYCDVTTWAVDDSDKCSVPPEFGGMSWESMTCDEWGWY